MVPLFEMLEDEIDRATRPEEPSGPEWPYVRAFRDGEANAIEKIAAWIKRMSKPSPDGAQNTED